MKMMKRFFLMSVTVALVAAIIVSCTEPKEFPPPTIEFITEPGYVYQDTSIALDEDIRFGFKMESQSSGALVHFNETINRDGEEKSHDYTLYSKSETLVNTYSKSMAETETWSFYCRDRDGRKSEVISVTITLGEGTGFSGISFIEDVEFGGQDNTAKGQFYSLQQEKMMTLSEAYLDQGRIDLVYYYDTVDEDENTIASPGANISEAIYGGDYAITRWTTKNTARFIEADISVEEFEASRNDSLILANTFDFNSGKRKAKKLAAGKIFSFVTDTQLKGMFHVKEVVGLEEGSIIIDVKLIDIE